MTPKPLTPPEFHARLKALARKRHVKLKDVEEYAGFIPGTIKAWKKSYPGADRLVKVAEKLETSVDYLLGITDCDLPAKTAQSMAVSVILNALEGKELSLESAKAVTKSIEAIFELQNFYDRENILYDQL